MSEPLDLDELEASLSEKDWCPERECLSNFMNMGTGERYLCPHRQAIAANAVPALIAQVRALQEALVKYGAHTGMCGYEGGPKSNPKTGYRCDCGLYDLVDEDEFTAALRQEE